VCTHSVSELACIGRWMVVDSLILAHFETEWANAIVRRPSSVRLFVRPFVCEHFAQITSSTRQKAGSRPNCTRWPPGERASRVCSRSRSRSRSKVTWYGHFRDVTTFCLCVRSLHEAPLLALHSLSRLSIRQLDIMCKSWNELLRHWRSSVYPIVLRTH